METFIEKTERTYIKLILGSVGALFLFILLCWGGFRLYRNWQEGHLVRRASAVMSGGDLREASLSVRRVLQLNPNNVEALRLMGEIAEKTGDRGSLELRRKAFELNPNSAEDGLAYVRGALWSNDIATAEKTLNSLPEGARARPEFHAASGRLAEMKRDLAGAEQHWLRAAELAPNESGYRFQLALLQLNQPEKRANALAVLQELRSNSAQRIAATRTLIIDGVARGTAAGPLRKLSEELQAYPEAVFSDRLMYAEILRQMRDPAQEEYVARLKTDAAASPLNAAALISWMIRNRMTDEASAFIDSLPEEAKVKWPVPFVIAEVQTKTKNWIQLEKQLRESDWATYDFLRRAYLARALREQGKQLPADQELAAAEKEASANPQMVTTLTQTIAEWGWKDEAVDLLWILTKNPQTRMPALRSLYAHYTKVADTSGLYRTLAKLSELNPQDTALQNNLAQVSLLIGADVDHARKIAAEVAAKDPKNAAYLSTYAYSLLSKGDLKGALQVMDGLSEEKLRDPSVATYHGLILAAAGQKEKAREFLRRSSEAQLLPEEKELVAKAERSLGESARQ